LLEQAKPVDDGVPFAYAVAHEAEQGEGLHTHLPSRWRAWRCPPRKSRAGAGVAESSIFYHFGDRLGLLQAVINLHLPVFSDATVVLGRRSTGGNLRVNLAAVVTVLERLSRGGGADSGPPTSGSGRCCPPLNRCPRPSPVLRGSLIRMV
jgi:hypothetical protein